MTDDNFDEPARDAEQLRARAELVMREIIASGSTNLAELTPNAVQLLVRELQMSKIELEMQNEELRFAQRAIDIASSRYFQLYDLAPVGYCTVSDSGLIFEANFTLVTMLGVARSYLADKPLTQFIFKEDQDDFCRLHRESRSGPSVTNTPLTCELRLQHSDKSLCWVKLIATSVADADGEATLRIALTDISAAKRAETALMRQTELLDLTGELAKVGGWEVNIETMKLTWTRETFRISELDSMIEPPIDEAVNLYAPEARPIISAAVKTLIETGTAYDLELPLITYKGRQVWVQTQGFAEVKNGKAVRIYGTFQDITARKLAGIRP